MLTISQLKPCSIRVTDAGMRNRGQHRAPVMRDHPISSAARYGLYGFCAWGSGGAAVAECVGRGKRRNQRAEKLTRAAGDRVLDFNGSFALRPPPHL